MLRFLILEIISLGSKFRCRKTCINTSRLESRYSICTLKCKERSADTKTKVLLIWFATWYISINQITNYIMLCSVSSIIFLIAPIVFNSGLAFSILMKEISKNAEFQEWFGQNVRVASLLTLLAGADVEVVTLLGSKFSGLKMFCAPLSKSALNQVFWGSTLNLFIEDIPQLIVQVCEDEHCLITMRVLYANYQICCHSVDTVSTFNSLV